MLLAENPCKALAAPSPDPSIQPMFGLQQAVTSPFHAPNELQLHLTLELSLPVPPLTAGGLPFDLTSLGESRKDCGFSVFSFLLLVTMTGVICKPSCSRPDTGRRLFR